METCFCAYSKALAAAPNLPCPLPPDYLSTVSKFQLNFSSAFYFVHVPELAPFLSNRFLVRRN